MLEMLCLSTLRVHNCGFGLQFPELSRQYVQRPESATAFVSHLWASQGSLAGCWGKQETRLCSNPPKFLTCSYVSSVLPLSVTDIIPHVAWPRVILPMPETSRQYLVAFHAWETLWAWNSWGALLPFWALGRKEKRKRLGERKSHGTGSYAKK